MSKELVCYYAHCKGIYGTPQEARDVELLHSLGFAVINPSEPQYDDGWKARGMDYADELVGGSDLVAFRALPDGAIPCGVYTELCLARDRDLPIVELPSGLTRRGIDLEQTREYLREIGER